MKMVSQPNVIIYILCENLNVISKWHVCVVFNTLKYIISNYATILNIIGVNKYFLYNFYLYTSKTFDGFTFKLTH